MLRPLLIALLLLGIGAAPAVAQDSETKIVLRISRAFLRTFLRVRFETDQPISDNSGGVSVAGNAHVLGGFDVRLHQSDNESDFDLILDGTIATQITATRRPVIVCAHGDGPFDAKRRIQFDQKTFAAGPICMTVSHHFRLDGIDTVRRGPLSPLIRGIAKPIARRGLLDGDGQAGVQIRAQITAQVEDETDKLVRILNHIDPAFAKVKKVVGKKLGKDLSNLQVYRTATESELLISVGTKASALPTLPSLGTTDHAPLELWISSKILAKERSELKSLLGLFKNSNDVEVLRKFLHDQLTRRYANQLKAIEKTIDANVTIDLVVVPNTEWIVLTFVPKAPIILPTIILP
jgi:hypothetical protein